MPFFDLPLEELQQYLPERAEPVDFDQFWQQILTQTRNFPLSANFALLDTGLQTIDSYDVTFNGFGGRPIKAWLVLPHHRKPSQKFPCVVEFLAYGVDVVLQWIICFGAAPVMPTL